MQRLDRANATAHELLSELVYELLDAHVDTMSFAAELERVPGWELHLSYLRDLQRVGREALAALDA